MVDESATHTQESDDSRLGQITGSALEYVTGLPAPVQKTLGYVLKRLSTSVVDIPAAYLEGKAAEMRATTDARIQAIKASGTAIAHQIQAPLAYVEAANIKFAERIVGKQKNLDAIAHKAVSELPLLTAPGAVVDPAAATEISDDWMNTFETEAENMSSDYMRTVFGKLLAGEVVRPGTFSRRAVKILGQMEKAEAEIFSRFTSLAIQFTSDGQVFSGMLMTVGEQPRTNGLRQFGFSYRSLLTLVEYGLVLIDLDGYQEVEFDAPGDDLKFFHNGKHYRCVYEGQGKGIVRLHGLVTSQVGTELMQLVTPIPDPQYTARLEAYLKTLSLRLEEA